MKKQEVKPQRAVENERAQPRQLVRYHFGAEDTGPKGEIRRSMSDMFFADVRHFEDIFREAEAPPSEPGKPQQKAQSDKLLELQKQVVNATWRIIRDTNAGKVMEAAAPDVRVVHESQGMALEQTKEAMEEVEDAEVKQALTEAWKSMKEFQQCMSCQRSNMTLGRLWMITLGATRGVDGVVLIADNYWASYNPLSPWHMPMATPSTQEPSSTSANGI